MRPILDARFPSLPHAAAYLGTGSDVLGFDTLMSTDHDWSPSVIIFLRDEDLPHLFRGYPTNCTQAPSECQGTDVMQETTEYPINHSVWAIALRNFFWHHLRWDIEVPLTIGDWLTFPSQELRGVTTGAVYHDDIG